MARSVTNWGYKSRQRASAGHLEPCRRPRVRFLTPVGLGSNRVNAPPVTPRMLTCRRETRRPLLFSTSRAVVLSILLQATAPRHDPSDQRHAQDHRKADPRVAGSHHCPPCRRAQAQARPRDPRRGQGDRPSPGSPGCRRRPNIPGASSVISFGVCGVRFAGMLSWPAVAASTRSYESSPSGSCVPCRRGNRRWHDLRHWH